jgi:hypothetical protein
MLGFNPNLKKYFSWYLLLRLLLLFSLAFSITVFVAFQIKELSVISYYIESVDQKKEEYLEGQKGTLKNAFDDLSSLIKAPVSLLYFDLYFENHRQASMRDSEEKVATLMGVDINDVYTHEIKLNEARRVFKSIRGSKVPYLVITRSFLPDNDIPLASTTPSVGSYYDSFMLPTWKSQVFIYFVVGIPLAYAILILINACCRFILFGTPFTNKNGYKCRPEQHTKKSTKIPL